jgi:methylthioribose-1-phosphate isomerase
VTHLVGADASGRLAEVRLVPPGVGAFNPAFDVTPARLVDGLLTEQGWVEASVQGVATALGRAGRAT